MLVVDVAVLVVVSGAVVPSPPGCCDGWLAVVDVDVVVAAGSFLAFVAVVVAVTTGAFFAVVVVVAAAAVTVGAFFAVVFTSSSGFFAVLCS